VRFTSKGMHLHAIRVWLTRLDCSARNVLPYPTPHTCDGLGGALGSLDQNATPPAMRRPEAAMLDRASPRVSMLQVGGGHWEQMIFFTWC
jgi:hypothetical protein